MSNLFSKPFAEIKSDDLQTLISKQIPESRSIEYKSSLPSRNDEDSREFLADVSSFSNTSGGFIIYGVEELRDTNQKPTGLPLKIPGLSSDNLDPCILRLENLLRDSISPRIPNVHIRAVDGFERGPALVIWIGNSWIKPHIVTFRGSWRCFSRNSKGKYQIDVPELRNLVLAAEELPRRLREFRTERISRVVANDGVVKVADEPKMFFHLVPLQSLDQNSRLDISSSLPTLAREYFNDHDYWSWRYNFDGYLGTAKKLGEDWAFEYLQLFRNGAIEGVDTWNFNSMQKPGYIPSGLYERTLIDRVGRGLKYFERSGIQPPFYTLLGFIGVKDLKMAGDNIEHDNDFRIEQDLLLPPDILIDSYEASPDKLLKPLFDMVWQSAGFEGSKNYSSTGQFDPNPHR